MRVASRTGADEGDASDDTLPKTWRGGGAHGGGGSLQALLADGDGSIGGTLLLASSSATGAEAPGSGSPCRARMAASFSSREDFAGASATKVLRGSSMKMFRRGREVDRFGWVSDARRAFSLPSRNLRYLERGVCVIRPKFL